jgi:prepilin-type N-terminal cleavage/methylation domain-containing protein
LARRGLRLRACERGFTLIEVLVTTAMALAVLTPTAALVVSSQRDSASIVTKAETVQSAQAGLREMVQDLDQAYEVEYPTSSNSSGCGTETAGVQACNIADVLARLTSTGQSGTDFEVRYDCTVASTTITSDRACWRYLCSATASTGTSSSCTSASGTLLAKKLVIDDLVNGATTTTTNAVFSFCYPNAGTTGSACANGATRPTSATVSVEVPASSTLSTAAGGDLSTVELTDGLYMTNLDLDQ